MKMNFLNLASEILAQYETRAKELFNFEARIELQINLKGHRLIGQCQKLAPKDYKIRLHHELIERYGEVYLHDVVPHELAHAVVMEQYPYRVLPHGKEYKATLAALEGKIIAPKNRPKYTLLPHKRRMQRFKYICQCTSRLHLLSTIRHNRIKRGTHLYTCKHCKGLLYESI